MNTDTDTAALVRDLLSGNDVRSAYDRLRSAADDGVESLLDALEGKFGPAPPGRHPRDVYDDLAGGLDAIAKQSPDPLIRALERRPEQAEIIIWILGGSRRADVTQLLVTHAKHKEAEVRWAAVAGLARTRRKSVQQPLLDALRDRSDLVRFSALLGLKKVADHQAIEPLRRYLAGKRISPGGKRVAAELLAKLEHGVAREEDTAAAP